MPKLLTPTNRRFERHGTLSVDRVMAAVKDQGLSNVQAVLANANVHLAQLVPARSVAMVAINFPDPWYKKRHHKRRVVAAEWLAVLSEKLMKDAELHAMSDYEPVAVQMRDLLQAHGGWENLDEPRAARRGEHNRHSERAGGPPPRPWRPCLRSFGPDRIWN